jgi:hypothetical protein
MNLMLVPRLVKGFPRVREQGYARDRRKTVDKYKKMILLFVGGKILK